MKVRQKQIDALSGSLEDAFVQRMVRHLRQNFPKQLAAQHLRESDLDPLVRRGINTARKYDVVFEGDVERYIEYMVILRPDFDRSRKTRWTREILNDESLDGEAKMDRIGDYLIFHAQEPPR